MVRARHYKKVLCSFYLIGNSGVNFRSRPYNIIIVSPVLVLWATFLFGKKYNWSLGWQEIEMEMGLFWFVWL